MVQAIKHSSHRAKGKRRAEPLFADSVESHTDDPLFDDPPFDDPPFDDPPFDDPPFDDPPFDDPPFNFELLPAATTPVPSLANAPVTTASGSAIKRTHERAISSTSSSISPPRPPRKYNAPRNPSPALLCSPDRNDLKMALQIGGGADLDMQQGTSSFAGVCVQHAHQDVSL
jgi:hypothetical protein